MPGEFGAAQKCGVMCEVRGTGWCSSALWKWAIILWLADGGGCGHVYCGG